MRTVEMVPAYKITMIVDLPWFEAISQMTSYREYGEVMQWQDTEGPFDIPVYSCDGCGVSWEDEEWLDDGKCPDGCDDEEDE